MNKSQKIREHILKHPNSGSSSLARRFRCSNSLVSNVKRGMRISNELKESVFESKSQMIRNHLKQWPSATHQEIAKKYKCTPQLVSIVIRQTLGARRTYNDSKSAMIREHLSNSPFDSANYISKLYECTPGLVHNVRSVMAYKQEEMASDKVTPTPKADNARTTPQIKRVKMSRSFLWGAIKYERYE
jgi:Mor family transcriptional regulator